MKYICFLFTSCTLEYINITRFANELLKEPPPPPSPRMLHDSVGALSSIVVSPSLLIIIYFLFRKAPVFFILFILLANLRFLALSFIFYSIFLIIRDRTSSGETRQAYLVCLRNERCGFASFMRAIHRAPLAPGGGPCAKLYRPFFTSSFLSFAYISYDLSLYFFFSRPSRRWPCARAS